MVKKLQVQMHAQSYYSHLIKKSLSLIPPRPYHNLQVVQGLRTASLCVLPGALHIFYSKKFLCCCHSVSTLKLEENKLRHLHY